MDALALNYAYILAIAVEPRDDAPSPALPAGRADVGRYASSSSKLICVWLRSLGEFASFSKDTPHPATGKPRTLYILGGIQPKNQSLSTFAIIA